jgi:hypothetical protein
MSSKKFRPGLIYVASNGRSGSTLLELLLGAMDNIWALGEVSVLPWELKTKVRPCGCGKDIHDCPFWQGVLKPLNRDILDVDGKICWLRESHFAGRLIRPKELFRIFLKQGSINRKALGQFCQDNQELFQAIAGQAEKRKGKKIKYLVDTSKDVYRLSWLALCPELELKVIHIIKDPRAFVYSMTRKDQGIIRVFLKTARMSLRYVLENAFISRVCAQLPRDKVLFVRYEDLASYPQETLKLISRWLTMEYQSDVIGSFRFQENHGIAGNKMRRSRQGIFLDQEWKIGLGRVNKILITALTYFAARKYGYF